MSAQTLITAALKPVLDNYMLAFLLVFLIVSAAIVAKIIAWAVVERPSLEIRNVGIFGIAGVIVVAVVGVLMGVTESFWLFISAMFVACLICFGVGENSKKAAGNGHAPLG